MYKCAQKYRTRFLYYGYIIFQYIMQNNKYEEEMPQIRSEWNTVPNAKTARKRSLQSLMETFLSTSLHERNVRPGIPHLMKLRIQVTRPQSINK